MNRLCGGSLLARYVSQLATATPNSYVLKLKLPGETPFDLESGDANSLHAEQLKLQTDPVVPLEIVDDGSAALESSEVSSRFNHLLDSSGKLPLDYSYYTSRKGKEQLKNKSLLDKYRSRRVTVTDLTTKYCEAKFFYDLVLVHESERVTTPAMARGTAIHEVLEVQVNGPRIVEIPAPVGKADEWAVRFYKTISAMHYLLAKGEVRELYIFGEHRGQLITGIIDLVQKERMTSFAQETNNTTGERLVIVDTKTRASGRLPAPTELKSAYHQVLLYHKLLEDITSGEFDFDFLNQKVGIEGSHRISEELADSFDLRVLSNSVLKESNMYCSPLLDTQITADAPWIKEYYQYFYHVGEYERHLTISDLQKLIVLLAHQLKGTLSPNVLVQYMTLKKERRKADTPVAAEDAEPAETSSPRKIQEIATFQYQIDKRRLDELLDFSMAFWTNERTPLGVEPSEVSKCKYCKWEQYCSWKSDLDLLGPTSSA